MPNKTHRALPRYKISDFFRSLLVSRFVLPTKKVGLRYADAPNVPKTASNSNMRPPRMDTAQLTLIRQSFDHPDFLFELNHDGFRALAYISDGRCELISRRRNAYKSFGELRSQLAQLKVKNAVIDGELVCLDSEGRSIFNELLLRKGCPIFYAFDLLYLNNRFFKRSGDFLF
jgi:ATP-dependent DNA ligase